MDEDTRDFMESLRGLPTCDVIVVRNLGFRIAAETESTREKRRCWHQLGLIAEKN